MISFALFVWFTMKYVWPPIQTAMADRQKQIADGLAAGERGQKELDQAKSEVDKMLREAREQASQVIAQANKRQSELVEQAREEARQEAERVLAQARSEIDTEISQARDALRKEVVNLAVAGSSRILKREIDAKAHKDLIDDLVKQL
ncbi:ATP synthase F0, B subunit [Alkalilimnicola ehrlichii MLHE-1]|nr:ATP synthase F0, B subunit [Alkalilimnicola ehrlichii MLHE-1]